MTAKFFEYLGWVSLSPNLKESFNKTLLDAVQHRHGSIEIEHLLFALVDDPEGAIALTQMGASRDNLRDELADILDAIPAGAKLELEDLQPARELKKLMAKASDLADNEHDDHIDGGDVVRALSQLEDADKLDFFLVPLQEKQETKKSSRKNKKQPPKPHARSHSKKTNRADPVVPQTGDEAMKSTPPALQPDELNFDMDPIRASIKAIMARRRDAEEILYECEWYHLFKSLNMIDEVLEGEEQAHRAKLLARAEVELAERPRCRKAFLYVRHLDKELVRLKGIVDIDWAGEISPDEAVIELARLRSMPQDEKARLSTATGLQGTIGEHLFDVKIQESEVLALEQKLLRLDKTAGISQHRLKELEGHLETHDTHSKKRENVIGELERYLRSEMQMADARDERIVTLEKELHSSKEVSESQIDKASHLEHELSAFKEHAGNREMLISDLEARLKEEKDFARAHEEQVSELRAMLTNEKNRAERHDKQIIELQKTYEDEKTRAATHEQQVHTLETDLGSRLKQLQAREEHIKNLQENLSSKENHVLENEEHIKSLQEKLSAKEHDVVAREENIKSMRQDLSSSENHILANEEFIKSLQEKLTTKEQDDTAREENVKNMRQDLSSSENHILANEEYIKSLQEKLTAREHDISTREESIKSMRENMSTNETRLLAHREQMKKLEADIFLHKKEGDQYKYQLSALEISHQAKLQKLYVNIQDQEGESQQHQQEINALRAQLSSMEGKLQDQETTYSVEKLTLANTIETMRREIEESESLIEIIRASGEPYRVSSKISHAEDSLVKIISRRTIPVPAKPRKS